SLPSVLIFTLFPYTTLFRSQVNGSRRFSIACTIERLHHHHADAVENIPASHDLQCFCTKGCYCFVLCKNVNDGRREKYKQDHDRSEEHTSELQSRVDLVCRL